MEFDLQWLLLGLPVAFALGWLGSRLDVRQWRREQRESPRAVFKGLNLLLNEQQDKAIDAFIEAVQNDPDTAELHFALGNLFRRRGEFERAVRVHQHLLARGDLSAADRERARHALAQDYMKAGLFDRAEATYRELEGSPFDTEARLALLSLYERSRDWRAAAETAGRLEKAGAGSFASRIAHHWCEIAIDADERGDGEQFEAALQRAREAAPQATRPLVLAAQRRARDGEHERALALYQELRTRDPAAFALVAQAAAESAIACGSREALLHDVQALYERLPLLDLLRALLLLDPDDVSRRERLQRHLAQRPGLSVASSVLALPVNEWQAETPRHLRAAVDQAALPLQRYRCAACGFEAQQYFWQCPGCLSWDSFPPQRLEEQ